MERFHRHSMSAHFANAFSDQLRSWQLGLKILINGKRKRSTLESQIIRVRKEMEHWVADSKSIVKLWHNEAYVPRCTWWWERFELTVWIQVERNSMAHHGIWNLESLFAKVKSKLGTTCADVLRKQSSIELFRWPFGRMLVSRWLSLPQRWHFGESCYWWHRRVW